MDPITLRPSALARNLACPGSIRLEAEHGVDTPSSAAAEGSRLHEVSASVLYGLDDETTLSPEDWDEVRYYVETVRSQIDKAQYFWVERTLGPIELGNGFVLQGTPDAVVFTESGELQIHDRKFSRGRPVEANNNPQLLAYALLAIAALSTPEHTRAVINLGGLANVRTDIKSIRLFIHQGEHTDEFELDPWMGAMAEFCAELVTLTKKANARAQYFPSEDTCRYCNAKHACPALQQLVDEAVSTPDKPWNLEIQNRNQNRVALVRAWADGVESRSIAALMAGDKLPDWKLVAGRAGARNWTDLEIADKVLTRLKFKKAERYEQKLISPTTAEKRLKGTDLYQKLEPFISQSPGKPSLAPASDKRPALEIDGEFFEDLT